MPDLSALRSLASPTLVVLVVLSVLTLTVGLERLLTTHLSRRRLQRQRDAYLAGGAPEPFAALPAHPAAALLAQLQAGEALSPTQVRRAQQRLVRAIRRRLWILGSIGSLAPFVGLLGTVLGVMEAFRAMGAEGAGGYAVVSAGISEALVTTAAGIFVAIEAVVLFNYLQVCVGHYAAELREAAEELWERRAGGHVAPSGAPAPGAR